MIVLGLNAYHADSAACIVVDGRLVAAVEEERLRRVKHWAGFPSGSVRYCLEAAGARISDVDHVAVNSDPRAALWRKLHHVATRRPDLRQIVDRLRAAGRRRDAVQALGAEFPGETVRARLHAVEHHLAHLASSYLPSGLDDALALSVDGFGDFASVAWGRGIDGDIEVEGRVHFPHSLGLFYQAMTQFLGFRRYGDEYKVMGLAAYGEPGTESRLDRVLRIGKDGRFALGLEYFRHHRERIAFDWNDRVPTFGRLYSDALVDLLGPARAEDGPIVPAHRNLAHATQSRYEQAFVSLLRALERRYASRSLCLAGGCAMNSVANGKVLTSTAYERVLVHPAAGDAGGAVGAALVVSRQLGAPRADPLSHAYWGPEFDASTVRRIISSRAGPLRAADCSVEELAGPALFDRVAARIEAGDVVGWFQGRMEWGPRALGNRSILADPRRSDMKERLNSKIKRRESFRPFAPSVLREQAAAWFEIDDDVPFMMKVYPIRPAARPRIPAVTHVDGTGRLQTVSETANPRYHALISAFAKRTQVPMLLNTSFNENEPIVCAPEEALDCFLRTRMDAIAIGDFLITRGRRNRVARGCDDGVEGGTRC